VVAPVNVGAGDVDLAHAICRDAAAAAAPISVDLGPLATFWPPMPVIYLAVAGDVAEIESLRAVVSTGPLATPPGRRQSEHRFVPHVTLNQRSPIDSIDPALAILGSFRANYTFEKLTLLEQDAAKRWHPVSEFPLGGGRVIGRGGLELELTVVGGVEVLDIEARRFLADEWESYSLGQYGPGFVADEPYAIVARREGAVVGVASGEVRGAFCELSRLIVGRRVRRLGVGAHLLRAVERHAVENGSSSVRLRTIAGGAAEEFYSVNGYLNVAVLPAWREGRDFVVMSRLVAPPE
jgi:2'-5' RNA ligase/GNAT superfamily N-acetyltransferase